MQLRGVIKEFKQVVIKGEPIKYYAMLETVIQPENNMEEMQVREMEVGDAFEIPGINLAIQQDDGTPKLFHKN